MMFPSFVHRDVYRGHSHGASQFPALFGKVRPELRLPDEIIASGQSEVPI
jgi:hypothetical protein